MNKMLKFFTTAMVVLFVVGFAQTASAWWGHVGYWGRPVFGPSIYAYPTYPVYGYGYYGYSFADPCCAPVVDSCCAPVATTVATPVVTEPICDTCGPYVTYDGGYAGSYVLGWRSGPIRRLLFGRYRWYATSYVGGYYYTPDCCAPTYGEVIDDAPAQNVTPATPATETPSAPSVVKPLEDENITVFSENPYHQASFTIKEAVPENSGVLTISVPADAVLYVNNVATKMTGSSRSFVSFGLTPGNEYDYVILAEVVRDGQKYVETQVVTLKAGETRAVAFQFSELTKSGMVATL